jgi:hypothetical protein
LLDLKKHLEIPANKAANLFNIDQPASRNTQLAARVQLNDGERNATYSFAVGQYLCDQF